MKKIFVLGFGIFGLNSFAQNDIRVFNLNNFSNNNIGLQQQQQFRAVQTFASNVQLKRNRVQVINSIKPANKVTPVQAVVNRPQVQRRRTVRRNADLQIQIQQPLLQINLVNVPPQMNPPAQLSNDDQIFQINVLENNVGNSFGNENIQIQQAAPAEEKQAGHAGDFLEGISLNLPKMNLKTFSVSKRSSSSSTSSYKLTQLKNKFVKVNRKIKGKLAFKKRLRLKVDNCFKW